MTSASRPTWWMLSLATVVLLAFDCGRTPLDEESLTLSVDPESSTLEVGANLRLRALSMSTKPDVRFEWLFRSRPGQSAARLMQRKGDASEVDLRPDVPGLFIIEVTETGGNSRTRPAIAVVFAVDSSDAGTRRDAGPEDAGTTDAGTSRDSGIPDGGLDAGLDGGSPDGGARDAGADAGGVDAGRVDGGGNDAGSVDAGVGGFDASVPLSDGGLDPREVYIAGTLAQGICGYGALAHWSTPDAAAVGFDCFFNGRSAVIRPSDRRLLYVNTFENVLREFHEDSSVNGAYPVNVLANDRIVATPCQGTSSLGSFFVAPDSLIFHQCQNDQFEWRDSTGAVVFTSANEEILAAGPGRLFLTTRRVVDAVTGASHALNWPVRFGQDVMKVRWRPPSSFFVVLQPASPTLWQVTTDGGVTQLGAFSPMPAGATNEFTYALDGDGRLFQQARSSTQSFVDVIVRREVGGTSSIVYSEAWGPLVQLHISDLVTGP